jgi:septal ring factor EnvC (AmiA/AmiB activator)
VTFRIGAALFFALGVTAAVPVHAQLETLWNCKDTGGRTTLTNQKADTVGKDCRIVQQERVSVVPAPKASASAKSPANFPRETTADRAVSKAKQRETIEKELSQEESMLADARKKLAEQEAIRNGNEQNYAKVLERLKPYKDTAEVHEKNVEALKRELNNLSR